MNKIVLMLVLSLMATPSYAETIKLVSPKENLNLLTDRIVHLDSPIDDDVADTMIARMQELHKSTGVQVIVIDSPGGSVLSGQRIIDEMIKEQAEGQKFVCEVQENAHSMAFNILTHCDKRFMSEEGHSVVHKIALSSFPSGARITAYLMRKIAAAMDKMEKQFDADNAKAMHLSAFLYDKLAIGETDWEAKELLQIGYLDDIIPCALSNA